MANLMETPSGPLILVVDDERQIRRFLRAALGTQGYRLTEAGGVQEAIAAATTCHPDLVILDLGLPDGDGIEVVRALRDWSDVPILILSVRGQEADKIAALDAGADDYLTKPFSTGELLARIRAALRRVVRTDEEPVITTGALTIDLPHRQVRVAGAEVHLTATEYALLKALATHVGKVLTHRQLLQMVWGPGCGDDAHMLRVNISNLRRKLEPTPYSGPRNLDTKTALGKLQSNHEKTTFTRPKDADRPGNAQGREDSVRISCRVWHAPHSATSLEEPRHRQLAPVV